MKILFSPEYSGHVFIGLNEQHPELMDTMVCDTMGLVAMLELRIGIHVDDISGNNRTVLYYKAMSDYMKKNPDNALAGSFKLSFLGTAEQALKWRDNLILAVRWGRSISLTVTPSIMPVVMQGNLTHTPTHWRKLGKKCLNASYTIP